MMKQLQEQGASNTKFDSRHQSPNAELQCLLKENFQVEYHAHPQ